MILTQDKETEMTAMHYYLFLKSLHIFGVILFLGNIIITGFWKIWADFTWDWQTIAFSQRLVTYTDIVFTTVGVLLIIITGLLMARYYGQFWNVKWIAWGLSLFIASGIIWVVILIPIQIKLYRLAKQFTDSTQVPAVYWPYERYWILYGILATVLPLINLYWMVFKPY